ncbi:MAG: hypothetical protein HYX78_13485 [Armatimonadetes bacterium]|nr:hypothetical protein [Armatimonadota bacterium]
MAYALQPIGKGSVPVVSFFGWDVNWEEKNVLLAATNIGKYTTAMMKRTHSIAQGRLPDGTKANYYRRTGSYVQYGQMANGLVRDGNYSWITWTDAMTSEQGAYPYPLLSIVQWTTPFGKEYYEENTINIDLR